MEATITVSNGRRVFVMSQTIADPAPKGTLIIGCLPFESSFKVAVECRCFDSGNGDAVSLASKTLEMHGVENALPLKKGQELVWADEQLPLPTPEEIFEAVKANPLPANLLTKAAQTLIMKALGMRGTTSSLTTASKATGFAATFTSGTSSEDGEPDGT